MMPTKKILDVPVPLKHAAKKGRLSTPAKSRTEIVHYALRQCIIEQQLKPGERLPEDTIGESFGTSRTIAREALGRLAVEGLVELRPNRGAYVANPTLDEGRDIFLVRRALERMVAECLSGNLDAAAIAELKAFSKQEKRAAGVNSLESIRLAGEFHLLLAKLTRNQMLIRYVSEVVLRCSLILAMYGRPHSADCGANEHAGLIAALIDGDSKRAVKLMDDHLKQVASRALLEMKKDRDIREVLVAYAAKT